MVELRFAAHGGSVHPQKLTSEKKSSRRSSLTESSAIDWRQVVAAVVPLIQDGGSVYDHLEMLQTE